MNTVNTFGSGENIIFTYGSTTMSVLEAVRVGDIGATVCQPIYLEPLPVWELEKYRESKCIVIEQSASAQFAQLLMDKFGLKPHSIINQYDGRPFDPRDLANKIKEVS